MDSNRVRYAGVKRLSMHYSEQDSQSCPLTDVSLLEMAWISWRFMTKESPTDDYISLSKCHYVDTVLQKFEIEDAYPSYIPMPVSKTFDDNLSNKPLRSVVGAQLYLSLVTRPDIAYAVLFIARSTGNPTVTSWQNAMHILLYLKHNKNLGIKYAFKPGECTLTSYADADWAGDVDT
eukprot:Awhi_evm1s13256